MKAVIILDQLRDALIAAGKDGYKTNEIHLSVQLEDHLGNSYMSTKFRVLYDNNCNVSDVVLWGHMERLVTNEYTISESLSGVQVPSGINKKE